MPMTLEALHQETGIAEQALINMRNMHKLINTPDTELEPQQRADIQTMMEGMIGDMSMNRQLDILAPMSGSDTGIGSLVVTALKDISYRTRNLKKIEPELDKIWENFEAAKDKGKILADNEKITLKQYGMLHDLATLNKTLEGYNEKGLIKGNEKLEKLYAQTQRAATMISHLDKTFNQTFTMPIGAVVFDDTKKKSEIYGKTLGFFERIIAFFVTKFGHASKGIAVENKEGKIENKVSHINPGYQQDKYNLRSYLYSDVYQIKIENLIDNDTKKLLQQHLGDKWLEHVQQKFGDIERQIHDQNREGHMHITAEGGKGRFAQIATAPLQGGHKNILMKDHSNTDIRDDIFGRGKWEAEGRREQSKVLCSEFVGQTIIASVQELNDVLKKELQEKGVQDIPHPIVKSPISEKEKLHLLTPERLLSSMEERGAVVKVDAPKEISNFVAIDKTKDLRSQMKQMKTSEVQEVVEEEQQSVLKV
ncbi:hypothetical protein [Legionella fallonii]|uniref:Uncharacterized protein n=1 Tax=Legionella fallonii LLAP-10 TaxID=1212491 RepID=A0A098G3P6_9GAMM|nr:hypothetical protein [Legionella fallonii]CEG56624.1 conserved protein of unknown function [Legionella fallonii LLAP-10]